MGFGLTAATDLQRAICRVIEGRPLGDLADHPHVIEAIGRVPPGLRPRRVTLVAGIRTAKSLIIAAAALNAAMTCNLDGLGPGEIPRFPVVSTSKDNARVIFHDHLVGTLRSRPGLQRLMIDEPTAESVLIRHPSGRPVEIRVTAGSKAGASLVARWLVGVAFDEAPRMVGEDAGVINLDHMRSAVQGRLRPGAQEFDIGSPWAPMGPVYEDVQKHLHKPTAAVMVIKARADWLNPYWWTPERAAELKAVDETAYQTDFLANFADAEEALIPSATIEACTKTWTHQDPQPGHDYSAAIDPATRGNAWSFVIADRHRGKNRIVWAQEWLHSKTDPAKPSVILAEIAEKLREYGLDWCYTDQWAADALVDIAEDVGLTLLIEDWTARGKYDAFRALRDAMMEGTVELCNHPALTGDLRLVKKVVTQNGVSIKLPKVGSRHCDFAPATARALHRWLDDEEEQPPAEGTRERADWEAAQRQAAAARQIEHDNEQPWWAGGAYGA